MRKLRGAFGGGATHRFIGIACVVIAGVAGTAPSIAIGLRTKFACVNDYRSYCSAHAVGSRELRQCMNTNGHRLSKRCINALVADGEISASEVARRAAGNR